MKIISWAAAPCTRRFRQQGKGTLLCFPAHNVLSASFLEEVSFNELVA